MGMLIWQNKMRLFTEIDAIQVSEQGLSERASMKRGSLTPHEQLRNKRISKKRCRGEHPYGTMHRSFKAGRTKLTTLPRVFVQHVFVCIAYNLHRLRFLLSLNSVSFSSLLSNFKKCCLFICEINS